MKTPGFLSFNCRPVILSSKNLDLHVNRGSISCRCASWLTYFLSLSHSHCLLVLLHMLAEVGSIRPGWIQRLEKSYMRYRLGIELQR